MDIKSTEAKMVQADLAAGRLVMAANGFFNIDTGCYYGKTNYDRFVRADTRTQQLNILSPDKTHFDPVAHLYTGEVFGQSGRQQMMMTDLLPAPSLWQRTQGMLPGIGALLGAAAVGAAVHTAYDYLGHHNAHAHHNHDAGYTDEHGHPENWHAAPAHHDGPAVEQHAAITSGHKMPLSSEQESRYVFNPNLQKDSVYAHADENGQDIFEYNCDVGPYDPTFDCKILGLGCAK